MSARLVEKVRSQACGEGQTLLAAVTRNAFMVAAQQHFGRLHGAVGPVPDLRTGVVRAVQQAIESGIEAVLLMTAFVAKHTRLQSGHGIEQCHGRNLAT